MKNFVMTSHKCNVNTVWLDIHNVVQFKNATCSRSFDIVIESKCPLERQEYILPLEYTNTENSV